MQTALRTFLISVPYIPKSVRIAKHSLFPRRSSKLCSSRVLKFFIVSFPFVYSRILTRLFPFGKYIRSIITPHTGFEPAVYGLKARCHSSWLQTRYFGFRYLLFCFRFIVFYPFRFSSYPIRDSNSRLPTENQESLPSDQSGNS